jgi:hypothetical protein
MDEGSIKIKGHHDQNVIAWGSLNFTANSRLPKASIGSIQMSQSCLRFCLNTWKCPDDDSWTLLSLVSCGFTALRDVDKLDAIMLGRRAFTVMQCE